MRYYFPSTLDEISEQEFLFQIENAKEGDTVVFSVCYGGDLAVGLKLAKEIRSRKLNTLGDFIIASAAVPAFCAGVDRVCYAYTKFFLHEALIPVYVETDVNETDLKTDYETMQSYNDTMIQFISELVGANAQAISDLIHANGGDGSWLNAEQAIDLNFITNIIEANEAVNAVLVALLNFNKGGSEMNDQKSNEDVQTIQQTPTPEIANSQEPVSTSETISNDLLMARIEAIDSAIKEIASELKNLKDIGELFKAEAKKKATAKIPPLDPGIIDGVLDQKKKSALEAWVSDVVKRF